MVTKLIFFPNQYVEWILAFSEKSDFDYCLLRNQNIRKDFSPVNFSFSMWARVFKRVMWNVIRKQKYVERTLLHCKLKKRKLLSRHLQRIQCNSDSSFNICFPFCKGNCHAAQQERHAPLWYSAYRGQDYCLIYRQYTKNQWCLIKT